MRATYDLARGRAFFASERTGATCAFAFDEPRAELEAFFSEHFERRVVVVRDREGGFPDDTNAPGPTLVSRATLDEVGSWFPGMGAADVRDRLRANLEIDGVPAFWEDRLFGAAGSTVSFAIGRAEFDGVNPCARCVVPSRDPRTGEVYERFAKIVAERRAATLPAWAERSRFDHFYRLTINTRARANGGANVRVGDRLVVDEVTCPSALRYTGSI
jgi:uncharacterized protein YcbX